MTGPFVFFDLRTPDTAASRAFYTELAGLTVTDVPVGTGTIPMFTSGDGTPWGGFTVLPEDDPRPPQWVPYLPVSDLDQAGRRAVDLGATVLRDRTDLPQGSLIVITDPGGATLALWQEASQ
jgi:predicted enzyme related to lactoylglutathione lyase